MSIVFYIFLILAAGCFIAGVYTACSYFEEELAMIFFIFAIVLGLFTLLIGITEIEDRDDKKIVNELQTNSSLNVTSIDRDNKTVIIACSTANGDLKISLQYAIVNGEQQIIFFTNTTDSIILNSKNIKEYYEYDCLLKK